MASSKRCWLRRSPHSCVAGLALIAACQPEPAPRSSARIDTGAATTNGVRETDASTTAAGSSRGDTKGDACTAEANRSVVVAMRPHSDERFGQLDPKTPVEIAAKSKDGWLGFDPGVAQAANVGPFRLRWLDPADVVLHGNCTGVPEIWTPPPGVCFEMTMEDVVVHDAPRADAKPIATLHPNEFAALVDATHREWAKIDLGAGNTGSTAVGWIPKDAMNVNGPCEKLRAP